MVGLPFNIASYALLTEMIAQCVNMEVGEFVWTGGDTHVYANHFEAVFEQLQREPRALPRLKLNPNIKDIDGFTVDDIDIVGYNPHPPIKLPVAK